MYQTSLTADESATAALAVIDMVRRADGISNAAWHRLYRFYTISATTTEEEERAVVQTLMCMLLEEVTGQIRHQNACRIANDMCQEAAPATIHPHTTTQLASASPPSRWMVRWWVLRNFVKGLFR